MTFTDTAARGGQKWTCPPLGGQQAAEKASQTLKRTTSRRKTVLSTTQGGGHVHFCPPLSTWLSTLKQRNITATLQDSHVTLDGDNITANDTAWLTRHHDALAVGATGTHPHWWTGITTGEHTIGEQIPTFGCAVLNCDRNLAHYSQDGVPFCDHHNPDWWRP